MASPEAQNKKLKQLKVKCKHEAILMYGGFKFTISDNPTSSKIETVNNVDLNFSADGHDEILSDSIDFTVQGVDGATNIMTGVTFTGGDADVKIGELEQGTAQDLGIGDGGTIVLEGTDGSKTDENDAIVAEDASSDIAVYTEQGSTSGSAQILMGVTVTAA